jgi:Fic family protein
LESELNCFIDWFNRSREDASLDPLLRAGIAHFWFITIHPLEDGNGRLARLLTDIEQTLQKTRFWQRVDQTQLSKEQVKILNRLLDGDFSEGISNSQYGKVANVSPATASRHLAQLVEMRCLVKTASGGRSTRYVILQSNQRNAVNMSPPNTHH